MSRPPSDRIRDAIAGIQQSIPANLDAVLRLVQEERNATAKKIAEKESTLHKIEVGTITPTLERARKLEKMLGLKLVEELKEEPIEKQKDSSVMTLGDLIKIKKKDN